ncbi:EAL domain-containing protein [Legionella spiritensis]|uniref:EAL domain-containing protein n=1 Tax=Legionella spiritensis TaxID=452 RepID=UPI000F70428F|nr:EAL domain-containing protein [Legionella spiritensis]VEG90490.1 regulatory protein (GGDEF domain) [Legionella spiritensis]
MNDIQLRIMIIDDNPAIHRDFIKVLTTSNPINELSELDQQLFGDDITLNNKTQDNSEYSLPEFIFETASQGREGVEKIKSALQAGQHYALAFVDVRMPPGWDGIETIKRMWEVDPDIQVVICTAYSDYSWEETVRKLGVGDNYLILKKPFDTVAVRQLACALTRKWLLAKDSKRHTEILQQTVDERTESLQQSLSLLRSTIESSADGILVLDLDNIIIDCNSKFLTMWHIDESMVKEKNGQELMDYILDKILKPSQFLSHITHFKEHIEETNQFLTRLKNGKIFECYSQPHYLNDNIIGRVWSFRDVTERANLEKKLEYQASHDMLTGLPNRVLLTDRIEHNIQYAVRHKQRFGILFFDLDRFKLINDSLSHAIGDELLRMIAKRLLGLVRKEDTLARLGGDEFVMIVPELADSNSIVNVATRVLQSFRHPFRVAKREILITPSIGISVFPSDGKSVDKLLKNADLAMYQAKEQGGNQFQFYTRQLNEHADKQFKQEAELRRAIEKEEFILYYQPQLDIENHILLSVEALIRWKHPQKGLLLPLDFIPAAEESGLIIRIGEWVIREACRQLLTWKKKKLPLVPIAVNVATQQLRQASFAGMLKDILEEYKIKPELIELEITENVVITNRDIIRVINQLQEIGVKIVLDDFGTGNSSLNYLKQLHIDRLKIDQSFVQNISTSRSDEVIIEAIIAMARSFNFKVVAEGVETQKQMNFLKKQNCDEVQGYLFSKPVTPDLIETYLEKRPI